MPVLGEGGCGAHHHAGHRAFGGEKPGQHRPGLDPGHLQRQAVEAGVGFAQSDPGGIHDHVEVAEDVLVEQAGAVGGCHEIVGEQAGPELVTAATDRLDDARTEWPRSAARIAPASTSPPAARASASKRAPNSPTVTSERSRRTQALESALVELSRRMNPGSRGIGRLVGGERIEGAGGQDAAVVPEDGSTAAAPSPELSRRPRSLRQQPESENK